MESDRFNQHCELLRHYSSKLFAARVSITTIIVIVGLLVVSRGGVLVTNKLDLGEEIRQQVSSGAALLVLALWIVENGYSRKLSTIIFVVRKQLRSDVSDEDTFFSRYEPLTHRAILYVYLVASIYFLVDALPAPPLYLIAFAALAGVACRQVARTALIWVPEESGRWGRWLRVAAILTGVRARWATRPRSPEGSGGEATDSEH